jgi:hypothetical protein
LYDALPGTSVPGSSNMFADIERKCPIVIDINTGVPSFYDEFGNF